jgi:hypothetical protein
VILRPDFSQHCVRASVTLAGGKTYRVKIPLAVVTLLFENIGLISESVGAPYSLRQLYDEVGFIKKLARKASSAVKSTARKVASAPKKATKALARTAVDAAKRAARGELPIKQAEQLRRRLGRTKVGKLATKGAKLAHKGALAAARSKALGVGLGVASTIPIVNAVAGPSLAAWTVANRADAIAMAAKRASDQARRGNLSAAGREALRLASSQIPAVKQAQGAGGQLVKSALKSMPAGNSIRNVQKFANSAAHRRALQALRSRRPGAPALSRWR